MVKRMLIDAAHPEEIRVVVIDGSRVEEFDFETSTKKQIKGNIYLAKVTRVEPSLQAGFVDYGGNRHGFLAFNEIHPDYYRIPMADRRALLAEHAGNDFASEPVSAGAYAAEADAEAPPPAEAEDGAPAGPDAARPDEGGASAAEDGPAAPAAIAEARPATADEPPPPAPAPSEAAADPAIGSASFADSAVPEIAPAAADADASEAPLPSLAAEATEARTAAAEIAEAAPEEAREEAQTVESVGGEDDVDDVERRRRYRMTRHYKIQEVVKRRQVMLVQVVKEERGTKGAALTTYLSLAGRYCVLMPNTARGGGISRRISSPADRKRLKVIMEELGVPEGMAVILRTAGLERSKAEIKRDYEYLMRMWDEIRELTLKSTAPCLVYEEANLIKRAIRDLYSRDIDEIMVEGEEAYKAARAFMKTLMPSHVGRIQLYKDPAVPLFQRFQVEQALDEIHSPTVRLRSGGYLVINPTEALVAIDVNSGRSTRERHIEETALKTNLEASDEIARQIRLRDLAGLLVIDFIDMEDHRNQQAVERRLKDAMKSDRARIQIGRISPFGLLELSRQRLRPSLVEVSTEKCLHCGGSGYIRSTESTALHVLRGIEEEGTRQRTSDITIHVAGAVAFYLLNQKRANLAGIEQRYGLTITIESDETLIPPAYRLERTRARALAAEAGPGAPVRPGTMPEAVEVEDEPPHPAEEPAEEAEVEIAAAGEARGAAESDVDEDGRRRRRRRRRRGGRNGKDRGWEPREPREPRERPAAQPVAEAAEPAVLLGPPGEPEPHEAEHRPALRGPGHEPGGPSEQLLEEPSEAAGEEEGQQDRPRRRSRRGGRRRGRREGPGREGPGREDLVGQEPGGNGAHPPTGAAAAAPLPPPVEAAPVPAPVPAPEPSAAGHDWPWNRPTEEPPATVTVVAAEEPAPAEPAARAGGNHGAAAAAPAKEPEPEKEPEEPPQRPESRPAPPTEAVAYAAPRTQRPPEPAPEAAEPELPPAPPPPSQPTRRGWWRRLTNGG